MKDAPHIVPASIEDVPALVSLVNSAYRGDAARKGWTHEADLISGTMRIDEATLTAFMQKPNAVLLKCVNTASTIVGTVYLEKQEKALYLGMLTVAPTLQGQGIGKRLLQAAARYASQQKIKRIIMTVINKRKELIDWYSRNGYTDTGERQPFPADSRFGTPTTPLEFVVLEKVLS